MHTLHLASDKPLLSIYYTAGYPQLHDTVNIAASLQEAGVDFLEIGIPYSDPVADGPTIQESSGIALENGMTVHELFNQLAHLRDSVHIPVFLMGYFNPILQYGVAEFCAACAKCGVQGVIIPDLPLDVFEEEYAPIFEEHRISMVFLITPQTPAERIRKIDAMRSAFIYMLSTPSVTGGELALSEETLAYFERIQAMQLNTPCIIGFGISNAAIFEQATSYAQGAIVGSKFVKFLGENKEEWRTKPELIKEFVQQIRP